MAVDRERAYFFYVYMFCDLFASFGCLLNSFFSFGRLGPPFETLGVFLGSQGLSLASHWLPFGYLGMPVGPCGAPWAPKWSLP